MFLVSVIVYLSVTNSWSFASLLLLTLGRSTDRRCRAFSQFRKACDTVKLSCSSTSELDQDCSDIAWDLQVTKAQKQRFWRAKTSEAGLLEILGRGGDSRVRPLASLLWCSYLHSCLRSSCVRREPGCTDSPMRECQTRK